MTPAPPTTQPAFGYPPPGGVPPAVSAPPPSLRRPLSALTRVLLLCSIGLFLLSLALPALLFRQGAGTVSAVQLSGQTVTKTGLTLLIAGCFAPFIGNFAGLANPLWLAGITLLWRGNLRAARVCLAPAVLFTLEAFQLYAQAYPEDEGGVVHSYLVRALPGWYCWCAAVLLALLAAFRQRRASQPPAGL